MFTLKGNRPMTQKTIHPTQNEAYGFYGTVASRFPKIANAAWEQASLAIIDVTGADSDAARVFLDSPNGRHFADSIVEAISLGRALERAIEMTIAQWMKWTISRETQRVEGIPAGLPYLTGHVMAAEMALERDLNRL